MAALAAGVALAACAAGEVGGPAPTAPPTDEATETTDGAASRPTTTEGQTSGGRSIVVGSITDGDTFRTTAGERVRLIGIDTPEPSQDECFADEATAAITALIPPGTEVLLLADVDPQDRYGRTLAYVLRQRDGLVVNLELAALGVAVQLTVPPNVAMADEIGAAVAEARDAGRGLWAGCPAPGGSAAPPVTTTPPLLPAVPTAPPAPAPTPVPSTAPPPAAGCHPSYPDVCIPPAPPDLDCPQIPYRRFTVVGVDPHGFDGDHDGIGCESG